MDNSDNGTGTEHILLTALGTQMKEATYSLGDKQKVARLAPLALLDLLPTDERPHRVLALCTGEAEETSFPVIAEALKAQCDVRPVSVPSGGRQDDIDSFLATVTDAIPPGAELTVDVTHGYRHFSFLMYVAVLYVAVLRDVRVRGAYYAMLRDGTSPFLDLQPLLALPRWVHALKVLEETGSTRPLVRIVTDGPGDGTLSMITRDFDDLAEGYLSGLPLELGQKAVWSRKHVKKLGKLLTENHSLPLANDVVRRLESILDRFELHDLRPGDGWKRKVKLTKDELERQASVIDHLLERNSTATGLGLMSEWTQNWAAYQIGVTCDWLDRRARKKVHSRLHAINAIGRNSDFSEVLTKDQRLLGKFWSTLCGLRNAYHHHGMRPELIGDKEFRQKYKHIHGYWRETLRSCPDISLTLGNSNGRRVLVSPIGRLPGVLLSSLDAYRKIRQDDPTLCIVVCSGETKSMVTGALNNAGYKGAHDLLCLSDPFGDVKGMRGKVKQMRRHFVGAEEVVVNVTGGTTLMGLATQKLAAEARKLACPVRRFGLIDRRPSKEQHADPYRVGEAFWLDSEEDVHGY